jgi:hypothetical protein
MRSCSIVLFAAAAAAALSACSGEKAPEPGETVEELTVKDCDGMPAPFSKAGCTAPTGMTDKQKKDKCTEVKGIALKDFKAKIGKDPDCSEGWIFGPNMMLTDCIKDSGKNLCKLTALDTTGPTDAGWPTNDHYSQCLNDWVVYCTDSFPAEMGVKADPKGQVCFLNGLDYDKLPATSITAREVCQRLKPGTPKTFPDKCPDTMCKQKMKPATKKGKSTCATSVSSDALVSATPVPCDDTSECTACDPATDPDCTYDVSCGCEMCAPGDTNPMCSEDLECPMPTPTPTPTPTPSPTPDPSPTPNPSPSPTPFPTPSPTPGPSPTPNPSPSPTPNPTPSATPFPTPSPTPFPTPSATPFPTPSATPFPTPSATPFATPFARAPR